MNGFKLIRNGIRKFFVISVAPLVPYTGLRIWIYRRAGMRIGKRVYIGMMCYFDDLYPERMIIEDDVTVSYRVTFATHGPRIKEGPIILRKGCYVGVAATIVGSVEIGSEATVGASALVLKNVPALATVVGVPAKVIKQGVPPGWSSSQMP